MATVTVLGAGAMGSALATPLRSNGHEVRLWGTWLDDHLLDACRKNEVHPRTGVTLAQGTQLFGSELLPEALEKTDAIVIAVVSHGVTEVLRRSLPHLQGTETILLTSKGFSTDVGTVRLLSDTIRGELAAHGKSLPLVAIGGPCKANEVACGRPTAAYFASLHSAVAERWAAVFRTADYQPFTGIDECGVEVCAALKNVYAIALGFADGLGARGGEPWHNFKSALFAQAVKEMAILARRSGGEALTASGLAGAGDLEVTGLSGRNKIYGSRVGAGEEAHAALQSMQEAEQTVEGISASNLASLFARQLGADLPGQLPLLEAIRGLVSGAPSPLAALKRAALST